MSQQEWNVSTGTVLVLDTQAQRSHMQVWHALDGPNLQIWLVQRTPLQPPLISGFWFPSRGSTKEVLRTISRHDTWIDEMYHFFEMTFFDVISCLICPSNYATGGKPWGILPNDPPSLGRLSSLSNRICKFAPAWMDKHEVLEAGMCNFDRRKKLK